jgi:hypothetical protein
MPPPTLVLRLVQTGVFCAGHWLEMIDVDAVLHLTGVVKDEPLGNLAVDVLVGEDYATIDPEDSVPPSRRALPDGALTTH